MAGGIAAGAIAGREQIANTYEDIKDQVSPYSVGVLTNDTSVTVDGKEYTINGGTPCVYQGTLDDYTYGVDVCVTLEDGTTRMVSVLNSEISESDITLKGYELSDYSVYYNVSDDGTVVRGTNDKNGDIEGVLDSGMLVLGTTYSESGMIKVIGTDKDGNLFNGYALEETLEKIGSTVSKDSKTLEANKNGSITGIDVSGISAEELRQVLTNGISETTISTSMGNVDTSSISGNIGCVYMKIGASSYGNSDFRTLQHTQYKEQVKVCEELGVPYGFYYYSTATTKEEAEVEVNYIEEALKKLGSLQYNSLPLAIDTELVGENDRQYGNVEGVTEARAYIINELKNRKLVDNVAIYTSPRLIDPSNGDFVLDTKELWNSIDSSNRDSLYMWLCTPGKITDSTRAVMENLEQVGYKMLGKQTVMDATDEYDVDELNPAVISNLTGYEVTVPDTNDKAAKAILGATDAIDERHEDRWASEELEPEQ